MQNLKQLIKEFREIRQQATNGEWFVGLCNQGETCYCRIITTDPNSDDLKNTVLPSGSMSTCDVNFVTYSANNITKLLDAMEVLVEGLEKVRDKETCEALYPNCEKYKSYEDGWEGVAVFSGKVLQLAEEKVK